MATNQKARVEKSEEEWKKELSAEAYRVLRQAGTEPAYQGEYTDMLPKSGYFACAACGNPLYTAAAKYQSGCGWPAFDKCIKGSISTKVDQQFGMTRTEILCSVCMSHLGHVFEEKLTKTKERHCVNSICVKYVEDDVATAEEETLIKAEGKIDSQSKI